MPSGVGKWAGRRGGLRVPGSRADMGGAQPVPRPFAVSPCVAECFCCAGLTRHLHHLPLALHVYTYYIDAARQAFERERGGICGVPHHCAALCVHRNGRRAGGSEDAIGIGGEGGICRHAADGGGGQVANDEEELFPVFCRLVIACYVRGDMERGSGVSIFTERTFVYDGRAGGVGIHIRQRAVSETLSADALVEGRMMFCRDLHQ